MPDRDRIHELAVRLEEAWTQARYDDVAACLDEGVVFVAPGFAARIEGRDACVQSYRDFLAAAELHHFEHGAPDLEIEGAYAMVGVPYTIAYSLEGKRWRGSGHDLLAVVEKGGRWLVRWRMLLSGPEQEVG